MAKRKTKDKIGALQNDARYIEDVVDDHTAELDRLGERLHSIETSISGAASALRTGQPALSGGKRGSGAAGDSAAAP